MPFGTLLVVEEKMASASTNHIDTKNLQIMTLLKIYPDSAEQLLKRYCGAPDQHISGRNAPQVEMPKPENILC